MKKRLSPGRSRVEKELELRRHNEDYRIPINKSSQYAKYFCHFNNGVYMGGMSGYKKHGKGIILHDDGSAVMSEYHHDTQAGHNIIFRENSISSVLYFGPNQFQIAYKQGQYIIIFPFDDGTVKINGTGILIDYYNHRIFRLLFKKGVLVDKILHLDKTTNHQVFTEGITKSIMHSKHQEAFQLIFERPEGVKITSDKHKRTIGFNDEKGQIQGLSFTIYAQNLQTNGERPLYLKFIERGYYSHSKLHIFGDKIFSNGNKYMGELSQGQFQGYGILVSPSEMKWVYGKFHKGQLINIEQSNYKKYTQQEFDIWNDNLRGIHRRHRQRWIDIDIVLPQEFYLYKKLKVSVDKDMTHIDPDREEVVREEIIKMSRIQDQFQKQIPVSNHHSKVEQQLDQFYKGTPIKIQELDQEILQKTSKILDTPINRFSTTSTPNRQQTEKEYRMKDPFAFQLVQVQEGSQVSQKSTLSNEPYQSQPLEQEILSKQDHPSYIINHAISSKGFLEQFRSKKRPNRPIQTSQKILENSIRKSRERQLSRSPTRQSYRQQPDNNSYLHRYAGSLINKRNFNYNVYEETNNSKARTEQLLSKYPSTSKYFPRDGYISSESRPDKSYSPQKYLQETLFSRKKVTAPQPRKGQGDRNFIKNNYQYWS